MAHVVSKDECNLPHNGAAFGLAVFVCVGVVLSYVPQAVRIHLARSSVGLSPWFLFLGATSSASAMFNVVVLQWPIVRCCARAGSLYCFEHLMGMLQVSLQWFMFTLIFCLFLVYYVVDRTPLRRRKASRRTDESSTLQPPEADGNESSGSESDIETFHSHIHQTYGAVSQDVDIRPHETHAERDHSTYANIPHSMRQILEQYHLPGEEEIHGKTGSVQEWHIATTLAWISAAHWLFCAVVTIALISTGASHRVVKHWARFLGITGTLFAVFQYLPQIVHTARARLVRSLSIPTMCVQVPGMIIFVYALASRKGVDWTSLLAYVVAGLLQCVLLALCIAWKIRQARLKIDDYGHALQH